MNTPIDTTNTESIIFEIEKGSSLNTIANNLKKQNLITSTYAVRAYSRFNDLDTKFIAGRFALRRNMSPREIIDLLTSANQGTIIITTLEGHSSKDIDNLLTEMQLIEKSAFTKALKDFDSYEQFPFIPQETNQNLIVPLEGYLFPDTYFVDPSTFTPELFITRMLENFEQKALPEINSNKKRQIHEIITMASIIDEEASGAHDAFIISDILWRRVDNGWFLGADATSHYLKDERSLTNIDFTEKSPYNTRKVQKGLPPGPIGNPGLQSIKASLKPETNNFWYYLHSLDGTTHYATSNDEHNRNKQKYL